LAAAARADVSPAAAAACVALFAAGWALTRGANLQKFAAKRGARAFTFLGLSVPMATVPGSGGRLLASGFWALSRHVNYLGETVQAAAVAALAWLATGSLLPFLYPLYYVALFVPRQLDDDAICAAKYGAAWHEYKRRVPWRIIPFVF
jgi:protein-S-isoprenylcysteine O-methyltransferase Ste14